jgi:putative flippase GtrA
MYRTLSGDKLEETKKQATRYLIVGVLNNVFYYSVFVFCVYYLELHYTISVFVAYPLSILTGYCFNTKFSFSIKNFDLYTFLKYTIIYVISFSINLLILSILIDSFGFESAIAQLFGTVVVAVFNFICLKFLVYV